MTHDPPAPSADLRPADAAQARSLAYGLLADLLARGLTESTREAAHTSAPLAAALATYPADDLDALAVDHEHAFGWAVPPFEGAFLEAGRTIGGETTDALWDLFRAAGFAPDVSSEDVEHLSTALRCMAFLAGAEADAIEDGHTGAVERTRELSRRLLDDHVLRWVPLFAGAVRRIGRPFPAALVDQIEALLLVHRDELPGTPRGEPLPEVPIRIDDEDTGLREIGELLATPVHAGTFLSREDVTRIGRGVKVPRGFGDRTQLLVNLLRSAAGYDAVVGLTEALEAELASHEAALAHERYRGIDGLVRPWRERMAATRALLRSVRDDATRFLAEPPEPAPEALDATSPAGLDLGPPCRTPDER